LSALYHQDLQGGNPEWKHEEFEIVDDELPAFLPDVIDRACANYARFRSVPVDAVSADTIMMYSPSLGIAGWSDPALVVLDYGLVDSERRMRERQERSFGGRDVCDDEDVESQNVLVIRLIAALGEKDSGRRAILKAMALKQGMFSDQDVDDLLSGSSERRLHVPVYLRDVLRDIGLGETLAPLNLFEIVAADEPLLMAGDSLSDLEFEVALDSGAVVHVCAPEDCPGYLLAESPGSKQGQRCLMGDGGTIANFGQKRLHLSDDDRDLCSVFQIATVTCPLMSVGKICDEGHNITFDATQAIVRDQSGAELCKFHRTPGGLYVAKMKLRNPAGFPRLE
jgi:hypothetical protein